MTEPIYESAIEKQAWKKKRRLTVVQITKALKSLYMSRYILKSRQKN